jgi:formate-dependent phosphoribosylglycinamide formyltransferase (GAR transformylase)
MRVADIKAAYEVIASAKLTKMNDEDKFLVIKATRAIKPIALDFDEFRRDAEERLKEDGHEEIIAKYRQWYKEGENTSLTLEEREEVNRRLTEYRSRVEKCLSEELSREVTPEYKRLGEEAFEKFVASNDYDVKTIILLQDILA